MLGELREGWTLFRGTTWLWVVVVSEFTLPLIVLGGLADTSRVMVVAGVAYATIALMTLCSSPVRGLRRSGPARLTTDA